MNANKCINGHDHCWKDVGLNLATCEWCGMTIMHDMSHAEFDLQDCTDRPSKDDINDFEYRRDSEKHDWVNWRNKDDGNE